MAAALALPIVPSRASTGAGELIITGKEGQHYTAMMCFNEYFSGPREFMPGQPYHSNRADHPGPFKKDFTVTYIDGRMVKHDVMFAAVLPGRRAYVYESRGMIEFFHLYTHELPTQGHLKKVDGDRVELRRFMTRRFDTGTPVFQKFEAEIAEDAQFLLNGKPSTRAQVLPKSPPENLVIRVFPAQKQTISAFHPESEAALEEFGPEHAGAKSGYMIKAGKMKYTKGNGKTDTVDGATLKVKHGNEWKEEEMPIDRKGYMILDGRYVPWRHQALRPDAYGVGATYRKWRKAKYFLVRSDLQGAWNGQIESVSPDSLSVKHDLSGEVKTIEFVPDGRILLDGLPSSADQLKKGMNVTIFDAMPQRVEAMAGCHAPATFEFKGERKGDNRPMTVIEYGIDRKRRVIKEGYGPFWQTDRSSFLSEDWTESAGKRFPPDLTKYSKEEAKTKAMALTSEAGPFYWTIPDYPPVP